jgi:hypothetical protein
VAEKTPIVTDKSPREPNEGSVLPVRRGRVESVDIYEIKDTELDILETGSPMNTQLNFAIFLLTVAVATTVTLFSAEFKNQVIEIAFIVATIVGFVLGTYFLIIYMKNRKSTKSICSRIRERISITGTTATKSTHMPSQAKNNKDQY